MRAAMALGVAALGLVAVVMASAACGDDTPAGNESASSPTITTPAGDTTVASLLTGLSGRRCRWMTRCSVRG